MYKIKRCKMYHQKHKTWWGVKRQTFEICSNLISTNLKQTTTYIG